MAKKTPGAVLLTWQDVLTGDWVPLVEEYTEISPLNSYIINSEEVPDEITPSDLKESEECYEKYLYRMKKMNLMINNV